MVPSTALLPKRGKKTLQLSSRYFPTLALRIASTKELPASPLRCSACSCHAAASTGVTSPDRAMVILTSRRLRSRLPPGFARVAAPLTSTASISPVAMSTQVVASPSKAREPAPTSHVDRHLHRGLDHRDHRATVGLLDCSQPMRRAE